MRIGGCGSADAKGSIGSGHSAPGVKQFEHLSALCFIPRASACRRIVSITENCFEVAAMPSSLILSWHGK
jgi:hypothetical protein